MSDEKQELTTAITLDIEPHRMTGAIVDSEGTVDAIHSLPMPLNEGSQAIIETIVVLCKRLKENAPATVRGVGISTIGLVHHRSGKILHAEADLSILQDLPLAEAVASVIHLPTRVENRVNAMAMAEAHLGAGQACDSFYYIFADETLNGAIMQNGGIWHGSHFSAGQIAHLVAGWMSQKPITLSQKASGSGIASEYSMRSRKFRVPAIRDILQYAKHGDQLAIRVVRDGAYLLASVLSPVVSLLDPQRVIVGGILLQNGDLWWQTFTDTLRSSPLPALQQVEVQQAQIKENAALIGAAMLILKGDTVPSASASQE